MISYIKNCIQKEINDTGRDINVEETYTITIDQKDPYETVMITKNEDNSRMFAIERFVKEYIIPEYFSRKE
jgi:hypothetical protein